jgi:acyl-coenzyme A synthetase/AMP-(fatty) acid ligase
MIDRNIRDLRLDRRMQHRRGWISTQDMEEALAALPDVAEKGELVTPEDLAGQGAAKPRTAAADPLADEPADA